MALSSISESWEGEKIASPFEGSLATVEVRGRRSHRVSLIVASCLLIVVGMALAGYFGVRYLNDPFRTLPGFPAAKYLDDYKELAGTKYKAELRVEADLGWKDQGGRLMLFSIQDDPRPFAVLLPPAVARGIDFTKGQSYMTELEVKEGGLIYADLCRKD